MEEMKICYEYRVFDVEKIHQQDYETALFVTLKRSCDRIKFFPKFFYKSSLAFKED